MVGPRHLIEIGDLSPARITELLDAAEAYVGGSGGGAFAGRVQVNIFYENSTRTLLSFALAGKRLGAHVFDLLAERSSVTKGESVLDTARTVAAIGADVIVLRHPAGGAAAQIAEAVPCAVINAGDGTNEHPTQALIDALALRRRFGRLEGLTVAICGDIRHSRVAQSNIRLLARMGARVRVTGPEALLPVEIPTGDVDVFADMDAALAGADAVMMLRIQHERMTNRLSLSGDEYHRLYGLTSERLAGTAPHAVVMHPGPFNRGVEIDGALADDSSRSLILDQVALGVPVRMACLAAVLG